VGAEPKKITDPPETASKLLKRAIDNSVIDDTSLIVIAVAAPPGSENHGWQNRLEAWHA
jgi:hypothetical protein